MAEDGVEDITTGGGSADPAALGVALDPAHLGSAAARDYLVRQSRLADLQIDNLEKKDEFELSHLRWRRFNDQMKGALQIMLVAVGVLIVVAIGAAVWNASQTDGLVVDAFSVPPDFEQRGASGDVIAADLTDKLAAIRQVAISNSYSSSSDVSADHANDIKVEIPQTGVSISEAWRTLRRWLGHERHLTGSLRENGDGTVSLIVSLERAGTQAVRGKASDLGALEQQLAEQVFGGFDPVNITNYYSTISRYRDAYAAAQRFLPLAQTPLERSDAYGLLSYTTALATGDLRLALARARIGIGIDPKVGVTHVEAARTDSELGDDEDALREARAILPLKDADQKPAHRGVGFAIMQREARELIALLLGDFSDTNDLGCASDCSLSDRLLLKAKMSARAHDVPAGAALLAEGLAATDAPNPAFAGETRYYLEAATGAWKNAAAAAAAARTAVLTPDGDISRRFQAETAAVYYAPMIAPALAHAGSFAAAHAEIDRTPADCVPCETARGEIAALQGNAAAAAFWFARAVRQAPSIPFAETAWGEMLLRNGDLDGAMVKFAAANRKGPRFADPLELWGEALIAKNRSDLALMKFEDAARTAPRWGRLHLKWGEALLWSGDRDGARKQFAVAAGLDLSAAERLELGRMSTGHG